MNFLYPKYCNDPLYVQKELTDEEFFLLINTDRCDISEQISNKDYEGAWKIYLAQLSATMSKRTHFKISDTEIIREHVAKNYSDDERKDALKIADDLVNYIFKLTDDEPFVFSKNNVPWNSDLGNSVYNQLFLTYMGYIAHLGSAYMLTGDSKYTTLFAELINSFIDTCPVPIKDDFACECSTFTRLGVALRLTRIINTLAVLFDDESFDVQIKKRIIKYMFQTARYVRKYNAENGNHVVVQMASLINAAAFYAEFDEADDWFEYALSRLNKELEESVYEDGVQAEASPNYHTFVLSELLILKALSLNGYDKIPDSLNKTMHDMFIALRDMCTPSGDLLNLGDTSIGVSAKKTLKLASCIYPDEFKSEKNVKLPIFTLCKFGKILTQEKQGSEANPPKMTTYLKSGFLSYRNDYTENSDFMFMHAGEGINGHAHADTLSIILYANGRNILLDSGNAPYVWNKERKYALSTSGHNTVTVDGENSHVRMLHWLPMRTAPCKIWVCEETDDYVLFFASHYGYHRFDDPVVHTRKLIYVKDGGYFIVLDLMNAEEQHKYEVFFHLPAGETEFDNITKAINTKFDNANVMVYPVKGSENSVQVIETAFHPNHNSSQNKPTLKITAEATGNKYFATLVIPYNSDVPNVEVKTLAAQRDGCELSVFDATVMEITINGKTQTIAVNNLSIDPREYVNHEGNPDSDAHMKGKKNSVEISVCGKSFNDEVKVM